MGYDGSFFTCPSIEFSMKFSMFADYDRGLTFDTHPVSESVGLGWAGISEDENAAALLRTFMLYTFLVSTHEKETRCLLRACV